MNKRINELAVQAGGIWQGGYVEQANGDSVYTDRKFVHGGDMDVEQFAQLLVNECIDIADKNAAGGAGSEFDVGYISCATAMAEEIKKRFGVEE